MDIGSWISGLTYVTGNAVKKASEDARKQLLSSAAIYLNVHMDSLDMRDRIIFVKDNPERSITFSKVLENHIRDHKGDPIIRKGFFRGLKDAEHG